MITRCPEWAPKRTAPNRDDPPRIATEPTPEIVMPEEIKTSGTSWNHASEITKWENAYIQSTRSIPLEDFGSLEEVSEQPIRLAYMGAGPTEEIEPRLLEDGPVGHVFEDGVVDLEESRQITKWRLRYPNSESLKLSTAPGDGNGEEIGTVAGENVEWFRDEMYVRPGLPSVFMLALGAIWCRGFQVGKRRMDSQTRAKLYWEFHELMDHALNNMPDLQATLKAHEAETDIRPDVLERLEGARDKLKGGTYHVDLPPFTVEIEDDEDDAPAPRSETLNHDPDPFTGPNETALLLGGRFQNGVKDSLLEAGGEPAETHIGKWGRDHEGAPVRVEKLDGGGSPYEGRITLKVQADSNADPAEVEAAMGWEILERVDMDTVWLHLLLLAHASAPHRRGERQVMTIPRKRVRNVLGFHRGDGKSVEQRAEEVEQHVKALQFIYVRFQGVKRHGDRTRLTNERNATPLWNIQMVEHANLFENGVRQDWVLKVKEGLWGEEFLHEWENPQWTPLPKEWFDQIDRRGKDWTQRLAVYLLFHFRRNVENGAVVNLNARTMLDICGADTGGRPQRKTERKKRLSSALDALRDRYGIGVEAERVHMRHTKGMSTANWKTNSATFYPPEEMSGELFRNESDGRPPLPDVKGNWTKDQIKQLRLDLDLYQTDMAELLDVDQSYVSQLESGKATPPSDRVCKILDRLDSRRR